MNRDLQTAMDFLDCGPESAGPLERLLAAAREEGRAEGESAAGPTWDDAVKALHARSIEHGENHDRNAADWFIRCANHLADHKPTGKDEP